MSNVRLWIAQWDRPFILGGRRIDPSTRCIETGDSVVIVEPRVMGVLIALAQYQGDTVRREDLIDRVWDGAPGADQSLSNAISLLRRALGDTDTSRRLIQTLPKQGYRLCVPVERDGGQSAATPVTTLQHDQASAASDSAAYSRFRRGTIFAGALAVAVAAFLGTAISLQNEPDGAREIRDATSRIDPYSIAVLPFVNMSGDPENDYLSDGLAEEILHALAQVDSLKVASRTDSFRFRGNDASIEEISDRLRVANVLEGSVRREGDRLRVTAQLISAADRGHAWSSSYDRDAGDVLAIQQDIALNIANSLVGEISDEQRNLLSTLPTRDFEAYQQYLIGNHELSKWTPEGNRRSIDFFKRAIALDPDFVEAQLAMGRAYYFAGTHYGWMTPAEAIPKVRASLVYGVSASNAVTRAAALSIYGDILTWNDHDWSGALTAFRRAYELSGTPPPGYALTNSIVGDHDAAIRILQEILESGARDTGMRNNLAWAYFNARRYDDALREAEAVLDADEAFADGYRVLGRAQLLLGQTDKATRSFSDAARYMNGAPAAKADLAVALARAGQDAEARAILRELLDADDYVPAPLIAQIYANLTEFDSAFEWLNKGMADRARGVIFLKINPLYDPVRSDPRFSELLATLNLES